MHSKQFDLKFTIKTIFGKKRTFRRTKLRNVPKISGKYLSNLVLSFEKKSEKFTQKVPKKLAQIRGEGCAIDAYKATHP